LIEEYDKSEACEGVNITIQEFEEIVKKMGMNPSSH